MVWNNVQKLHYKLNTEKVSVLKIMYILGTSWNCIPLLYKVNEPQNDMVIKRTIFYASFPLGYLYDFSITRIYICWIELLHESWYKTFKKYLISESQNCVMILRGSDAVMKSYLSIDSQIFLVGHLNTTYMYPNVVNKTRFI